VKGGGLQNERKKERKKPNSTESDDQEKTPTRLTKKIKSCRLRKDGKTNQGNVERFLQKTKKEENCGPSKAKNSVGTGPCRTGIGGNRSRGGRHSRGEKPQQSNTGGVDVRKTWEGNLRRKDTEPDTVNDSAGHRGVFYTGLKKNRGSRGRENGKNAKRYLKKTGNWGKRDMCN